MSTRIIILKRIRSPISKPVIVDQHARIRHNRIGTNEHPHQRIIVACVHVDQPAAIQPLTGVVDRRGQRAASALFTVGEVALIGGIDPRTVSYCRNATQMVRVQILQRGPGAHGDRHAAEGVVLLNGRSAHLVVTEWIEGGGCTNRLLDPNAVLIVEISLARDGVQAVLHVPDEGLAAGAG